MLKSANVTLYVGQYNGDTYLDGTKYNNTTLNYTWSAGATHTLIGRTSSHDDSSYGLLLYLSS